MIRGATGRPGGGGLNMERLLAKDVSSWDGWVIFIVGTNNVPVGHRPRLGDAARAPLAGRMSSAGVALALLSTGRFHVLHDDRYHRDQNNADGDE